MKVSAWYSWNARLISFDEENDIEEQRYFHPCNYLA
jgi:hypothetical protein